MSHISDTIQNCHVLLERYRWMAGDLTRPPIKLVAAKDKTGSSFTARPVTEAEENLIAKMYREGKTLRQIMTRTNRGNKVIQRVLRDKGIPVIPVNRIFSYRELRQIEKLWNAGKAPLEIAEKMGINASSMYRIIDTLPQRLAEAAKMKKKGGK
jgi:hypothetical protein